jgi:hypothetical protein
MSELERIKITASEVEDTRVDELVKRDQEARRPAAPANREPRKVPLYYNPMFVYGLFGALGALCVCACIEPFITEGLADEQRVRPEMVTTLVAIIAYFPLMGGIVGLFIAGSDALLARNIQRAFHCGIIGLGVGCLAGFLGMCLAGFVYQVPSNIATEMARQRGSWGGIPLFIQMGGRAFAWTLAATGMGIGQGIALKSKKLIINGLVGGMLGGFLGGLAFDPIAFALGGTSATAATSRFFGFTTIGLSIGFFIGLVESMSKDAWLYMKAGPLAGKQFVIYKDPTTLGSSPKCDIYLFKDAAIEPNHAELRSVGTRYQLKDLGSRQGTFVNGARVESHMLQPGDTVVLGETVLEYAERERK